MPIYNGCGPGRYTLHLPAVDTRTPPVQNTWYTVLDHTGAGELKYVSTNQTNDETAAKDRQVRITVDGVVFNFLVNVSQANNTIHNWFLYYFVAGPLYNIYSGTGYRCIMSEDEGFRYKDSILVEHRMTSAVGTNQIIMCGVGYETLEGQ
jgi:hypothetical protein